MWLVSRFSLLSCYCKDHAQRTAKLCLLLSDNDCFCSLWNETPLQIFNVFYASQKCLHFIKNKASCFLWFLRLSHVFITGILKIFGTKYVFCIENWFWSSWLFYWTQLKCHKYQDDLYDRLNQTVVVIIIIITTTTTITPLKTQLYKIKFYATDSKPHTQSWPVICEQDCLGQEM
jgi:hypothetical protein